MVPAFAAPAPGGDFFLAEQDAFGGGSSQVSRLGPDGVSRWALPHLPEMVGLRTNAQGDLAVFGVLSGSPVEIGGDVLVSAGYPTTSAVNTWVARLDGDGHVGWARTLGGLGATRPQAAWLATDGEPWLAGHFDQTGVFDGWILERGRGEGPVFLVGMPDRQGK
jgi:hypothetical protein